MSTERAVYRESPGPPIFLLAQGLRCFDFACRCLYHAPAMAKLLTALEAPARLASSGQAIEISDEISSFPRLSEALAGELERLEPAQRPANWQRGVVTGTARFDFADPGSRDVVVEISARADVPQVCQRCLGAFDWPLETDAKLLLARGDDPAEREGYETWEVEDALLKPIELVDELLVMALPFAAMHADDADCVATASEDTDVEDTVRPFADLKAQIEAASAPDEPVDD